MKIGFNWIFCNDYFTVDASEIKSSVYMYTVMQKIGWSVIDKPKASFPKHQVNDYKATCVPWSKPEFVSDQLSMVKVPEATTASVLLAYEPPVDLT